VIAIAASGFMMGFRKQNVACKPSCDLVELIETSYGLRRRPLSKIVLSGPNLNKGITPQALVVPNPTRL
jgi:hypothetical protein